MGRLCLVESIQSAEPLRRLGFGMKSHARNLTGIVRKAPALMPGIDSTRISVSSCRPFQSCLSLNSNSKWSIRVNFCGKRLHVRFSSARLAGQFSTLSRNHSRKIWQRADLPRHLEVLVKQVSAYAAEPGDLLLESITRVIADHRDAPYLIENKGFAEEWCVEKDVATD
jgi:hypothetical protein